MNSKLIKGSIVAFAVLLTSTMAMGQTGNWNVLAPDNNMIVGNQIFLEGNEKQVEGTPLLFDTWLKGYLVLKGKTRMEDIRINLFNQKGELFVSKPYAEMEVRYAVDETLVEYFVVTDSITGEQRRFEYLSSKMVTGVKEGAFFYETLFDNGKKLVKLTTKSLLKAEQEKAYALKGKKSRYIIDNVYYFKSESGDFELIRLKKKDLQAALGDPPGQKLSSIMKSNKWSWSKEKDVLKLLAALQ